MSKNYWVSLFSGVGGSTVAASQLGFEICLGVENNGDIADIYRSNFPNSLWLGGIESLSDLQIKHIPTLSERIREGSKLVVQVSPPCQDYSVANLKHKSLRGDRSDLLNSHEFLYRHLRPDYVIVENVPSFLNSNSFARFKSLMLNNGYLYFTTIYNSYDLGVPQNRRRMFAVFYLSKYRLTPDLWTFTGKKFGWFEVTEDLIRGLIDCELTKNQIPVVADKPLCLVERVGWYKEPKTAHPNSPCWTLRSHLADTGRGSWRKNVINVVTPTQCKITNTPFMARLQGFPDSFVWSECFGLNVKGIGNSVSPPVMRFILENIV